jgi:iron complex transport system permease protein
VRSRPALVLLVLVLAVVATTLLAVCLGSVAIPLPATLRYLTGGGADDPTTGVLLAQVRLPRAATAAVAGAGLAVAGLLLQTLFANPLADPSILGVSSGAGMGVAISVLGSGTSAATFVSFGTTGRFSTVVAAAAGALVVLGVVLAASRWVRSVVALLLIGVMVGAASGAVVSLLLAFSDPARIQRYVLWGFGSVSGVTWTDLRYLAPAVGIGVVLAWVLARPLNALLLGERYAASLGVPVRRLRWGVIVATAIVTGAVTAFCGPIAFLGIAVPHLARQAVGRADHRLLVPASALLGAVVCQLCSVIAVLPGESGVLPLNVVTAAVGAPVVIAVLLRSRTLAAGAA